MDLTLIHEHQTWDAGGALGVWVWTSADSLPGSWSAGPVAGSERGFFLFIHWVTVIQTQTHVLKMNEFSQMVSSRSTLREAIHAPRAASPAQSPAHSGWSKSALSSVSPTPPPPVLLPHPRPGFQAVPLGLWKSKHTLLYSVMTFNSSLDDKKNTRALCNSEV